MGGKALIVEATNRAIDGHRSLAQEGFGMVVHGAPLARSYSCRRQLQICVVRALVPSSCSATVPPPGTAVTCSSSQAWCAI